MLVVSHAALIPMNQEPFRALADAGADVTVIAPRTLRTDIRGLVRFAALEGFADRMRTLPVLLGGYRRWLGGQRGIHLIAYRGLAHAVGEAAPQVVFVEEEPYSLAAWQVARAARAEGVPFVVHENQNIDRAVPFPFERMRSWVLEGAAGVTVRNQAAEDLVRARGFAGRVERFPHAIDLARYAGGERRTDLPAPVVGFVGRLVAEKGILDVIEAVRDAGGSLLVVGDGPLREEAERRAAGLAVRFIGPLAHEDVPGWYASMDVVAIPSRSTPTWKEQFGRIVIEANAAGVPVIASDSGELPHTVAATGGGVVVPEGDVDALRAALKELAAVPERRRALGDAGRSGVAEHFTHGAVAARLLALLREVAA